MSMRPPSREMPSAARISSSAMRNGGDTLFFTTFTRTRRPMMSVPFLMGSIGRMSSLIDIRPIEPIKNGTDIIGRRVRVKVVKNKVSPPFRIAELEILAAEGISREGGLIDMGVTTGVLDKSGAWINYGKQRIGQGREAAKQFLREHADVANEVEQKVRERSGAAAVAASPDGEEG